MENDSFNEYFNMDEESEIKLLLKTINSKNNEIKIMKAQLKERDSQISLATSYLQNDSTSYQLVNVAKDQIIQLEEENSKLKLANKQLERFMFSQSHTPRSLFMNAKVEAVIDFLHGTVPDDVNSSNNLSENSVLNFRLQDLNYTAKSPLKYPNSGNNVVSCDDLFKSLSKSPMTSIQTLLSLSVEDSRLSRRRFAKISALSQKNLTLSDYIAEFLIEELGHHYNPEDLIGSFKIFCKRYQSKLECNKTKGNFQS